MLPGSSSIPALQQPARMFLDAVLPGGQQADRAVGPLRPSTNASLDTRARPALKKVTRAAAI